MRSQEREPHVVRAGGGEIHMDMSEEPFRTVWKITRKMPDPKPAGGILWKFIGKVPDPYSGACTLCGNLQVKTRTVIPQEPFCVEIYRKNVGRPRAHLDQTPAPNCDRKNPSVWPHCLANRSPILKVIIVT